jgi:myo-inositol-1(or 4)-monophosphatase
VNELVTLAEEAATRAGEILLEHFAGSIAGLDTKTSPTDPVSDADRASEAFLLDFIAAKRPQDGVIAEEGGEERSDSGLTWVLDPLDGTVNFLYRIPTWCVSIAIDEGTDTIVGVIHDPNRKETFSAAKGNGAYMNGSAIRVSEETDLSKALIGTGFSYEADAREVQAQLAGRIVPAARDIRRAGSAAIDLSSLACGRLDGFYEAPMERWDKAAGVLIAREAGATVTELPPPKEGLPPGVIGANPTLHQELSNLLLA